ncbi:hypothetical protein QYM36_012081, partial [Artemia franciscana]
VLTLMDSQKAAVELGLTKQELILSCPVPLPDDSQPATALAKISNKVQKDLVNWEVTRRDDSFCIQSVDVSLRQKDQSAKFEILVKWLYEKCTCQLTFCLSEYTPSKVDAKLTTRFRQHYRSKEEKLLLYDNFFQVIHEKVQLMLVEACSSGYTRCFGSMQAQRRISRYLETLLCSQVSTAIWFVTHVEGYSSAHASNRTGGTEYYGSHYVAWKHI